MFFTAKDIALRNISKGLVHKGLRPGQIVTLLGRTLGNALVDELTRSLFDGREIAPRDVGVKPRLLFRCERNRHGQYHNTIHKRLKPSVVAVGHAAILEIVLWLTL